jgi:acetyl esterase
VFCHGGGYVFGGLETSDAICRALCHGAQCVVLSVDYRLAPEQPFPAATDDAYAALLWAVAHAPEIGVDQNRIAVGGESAGGNLATVSALRARDTGGPDLCAQLLMYPGTAYPDPEKMPSLRENADAPLLTTDDAYYCWDQYLPHPDNRQHPYALPSLAKDLSLLPPSFVATGEYDPVRDDGEMYGSKMQAAGNSVIVRRYAGMPHGFFSFVGYSDAVKTGMEEVCDWLKHRFV